MLTKLKLNEDGEQEFIGTDKDFEEKDRAIDLEIEQIREARHEKEEAREAAWIQFNEETKI